MKTVKTGTILLFAGTTEGREIAEYLQRCGTGAHVCVATEYGESLLNPAETIHQIHTGRMDEREMQALMREQGITAVIDATHPYAQQVSENIETACKETGCRYIRLLRDESETPADSLENPGRVVFTDSIDEAVTFLGGTSGNILAATGSRELHKYTALEDFKERVYARVLSTPESVQTAAKLGFEGKHLICMQGPFTVQMNEATLRSVDAKYMVTKESGKTGGFPEKVLAAQKAGAVLVVVGRPPQKDGIGITQLKRLLFEEYGIKVPGMVYLVGIGMGSPKAMTVEARDICEKADVLIGASRMLEAAAPAGKPVYDAYRSDEICAFIQAHPEYENTAVVLSGDPGFYSGAKKLIAALEEAGIETKVIPGISSAAYFCARLKTSWEDARLISMHGRAQNLIAAVKKSPKVFTLAGKQKDFSDLCRSLICFGLGHVKMAAGSRLSYEDEQIFRGTPEQLMDAEVGDLSVVLIENPEAKDMLFVGLEDERFIRGKVPMTKSEVRSVSMARLHLCADSVCWDVGAGTGSVSVEMALCCPEGMVYAAEKKPEAVTLIRQNAAALGASNLVAVQGEAPEILEDLPAPDRVFVGGSSGNLEEIVNAAVSRNPQVRIVINAISLETVTQALGAAEQAQGRGLQISCIQSARAKTVSSYHMMIGENPVYVISFDGPGESI